MTASLVGVALIVVLVPQYIPPLVGEPRNEIAINCYKVITTAGTVYAVFAALVLLIDIGIRARDRFVVGVKADQIKFGKGMVEEKDKQNVFMCKCWQLPYCRKFVRERCPIYHARRSCWRERVGCMCEEQVIRNAMEGKTIPKNVLAAAAFIPKNHKLTMAQKRNRCRQCVIYNERCW
ncbi:MAG: hypothetical protein HY248_00825 [Fimbriimonas ginsengisoli]|nr:hypothetical protein [Fimbriimonas ginsengisoli]